MALAQVISKERREKKSPLENAALGLGLAQSLAGIGDSVSEIRKNILESAAQKAAGTTVAAVEPYDALGAFSKHRLRKQGIG